MSIYLGIDLGSTTTKAILLDENEEILGRGITNTRSDYHVATAVAENEARINARFTLLRRSLEKDGISLDLLQGLEDHFRQEAFRFRLRRLQKLALEKAAADGGPSSLAEAVTGIFRKIEHELADDPRSAVRLRNSFFRDIAGCSFMSLAEENAGPHDLDFEDLMGVYDEVILVEENSVMDIAFADTLLTARVVNDASDAVRDKLCADIRYAATASLENVNMFGTGYGRQRLPTTSFRPPAPCWISAARIQKAFRSMRRVLPLIFR
jgi:benzoyl-CoA reductase subunit A